VSQPAEPQQNLPEAGEDGILDRNQEVKHVRHVRDTNVLSLSGAKLDDITNLIQDLLDLCPNAKCTLVHCGTNNVDQDTCEEIVLKTVVLVTKIRQLKPDMKILVSSILPKLKTDGTWNKSVDQINEMLWAKSGPCQFYFVASYKVIVDCKTKMPNHDYYLDGIHLNKMGTLRLRQFLTQVLSEQGHKSQVVFSSSTYLRRSQWQGSMLSQLSLIVKATPITTIT
jgi:hypothetical protein